jgi:hypothetical protein
MIRAEHWTQEDLKCNPGECHILQAWQLNLTDDSRKKDTRNTKIGRSLSTWSPPPPGFVKLNFDGASKGNPGTNGFWSDSKRL